MTHGKNIKETIKCYQKHENDTDSKSKAMYWFL